MPRILTGNMVLGFFGLPKWLTDPFGYIKDKLLDLYNSLGTYIQQWIVNPPHPAPAGWINYLYGNALGLSVFLIASVSFLTLMMMIAGPRFVSKFWKAVMVTVLIAAIYPAWFAAGNWFSDAGSGLIQSIAGNPGAHHAKLLIVPNIHNVLGAIFGLLFLLLGGGILLAIFFLYELLLVVATVIGLPLLALSPLSDSFRRKFEQMIVLVFVTSFFGRLAAVAILSVGTQFVKHVTVAHNAVGAVFTLVATLALAIYSQWWLLRKADQIYGNVTGRTLGISKVTGVVESIRRPQRREADMSDIQAAHLSALTPAVVPSPSGYRMGSSAVSSTTSDPTSAPRVSTSSHEGRWAAYRNRRKNTTD